MKKLLFAGFAALLFLGCSDDKTTDDKTNPDRPIAGLEIPREALAGEDMTIKGKGFAADCKLALQLNGTSETSEATVVSVDKKSLVVSVPGSLDMGFYSVILTQNNATTTIGGVNIRVNKYTEDAFEIYGLSGENLEIYPVSVSKQIKASAPLPNSSALVTGYSGFATATPSGVVYFTGFEPIQGGKLLFRIGSYNLTTGVNTAPREVADFACMGVIDDKLCILKTVDKKTYTLVEWNDGAETKIRDFDLSAYGGGTIYVHGECFVYHAATKTVLVSGNMGSGEDMSQAAFSLDVQSGAVNKNGGDGSVKYWFASTGDKLYSFVVSRNEDERSSTRVFRIDDPQQWTVRGSGATLVTTVNGSAFEGPVYSPVSKMIYGFDDYETFGAVLAFNPEAGKIESRRWVGPALACMFYAPRNIDTEE